jgi:hypothetical protein
LKNIFRLFSVFCFISLQLTAQKVPTGIPFQGIAKDYLGAPVNERKIFIQTTLIAGSINGNPIYKEEHATTTDPLGIFSIMIGQGNKTAGIIQSLADLKWEEGPYYLNVQLAISPNAPVQNWSYQANWMDMGTTAMGIVPYAFYAVQTSGLQNKLSITDTANMLRNYVTNHVIQLLDSAIASKLSAKDTISMLAPYAKEGSSQTSSSSSTTTPTNAFSGAYNDLTGKPALFSGAYNDLTGKPVLFDGDYNLLSNKPLFFSGSYLDLNNTPSLFSGAYNDLTGKPVLFDGDYTNLTNKPVLTLDGDITNIGNTTTLSISGVASGTYGSALAIPTITVDEKGRITAASSTSITPNNFPNKTNAEKNALSASTATGTVIWCSDCGTRGQLQVYNGMEWTDLTGGTAASSGIVFTALNLSAISSTSASAAASISSDGGASITAKGVVWSTSVNPTIALTTKTNDGTGTSAFTSSLTALSTSTLYYIRAYATNANGIVYGAQQSFTTLGAVPTLSTTSATGISLTGGTTGGNITYNGGTTITRRGVCWSTSSNPTINDNKLVIGSGDGSFTVNLTGLMGGTTYYIRAYATNGVGTGYGSQITLTTSAMLPGVAYLGGKIAYIFQAGDVGYVAGETHGFIIMSNKIGITGQFGGYNPTYSTYSYANTSTAFGSGMNNTRIMNGLSWNNFAKNIYNVSYSGYSDWYVPSSEEWNKIIPNWASIGIGAGNFQCTSEVSQYNSYYVSAYLSNNVMRGNLTNGGKTSNYDIIGIRNF